ncbi:hypothetical protein [Pseudomonas guariconensis]|uniref:DUF1983 domain-containing protein n=1 Tax=Pseudomonas guariconensis TaxID=1288410 RepID=A0AAX0VQ07_9PSED|nr:hypothetical protein [Pseudomonas guariconensis]PLV13062.1 hypothetical protein CXG49_24680 [Pseudomonas guariconensis]PLV21506.1 hypothetical protein CXG53_24740 [Pseudomonas guariconensis]PLV26623.1 hypothetical protein CXG51_24745 [Pseudomonas guariconensis]
MDVNVIQSADYVPGMSGYRLDLKAGVMEINSGHMAVGSLPSDPQMITVTASEWPESEVPAGAKARLAFLQEQIGKVPVEFRADAEFSTEDISFDHDGSDIRTTLTYRRLETDQEAAERVARQAGPGMTINADGVCITANGKVVVRLGRCMDDERPAEQPCRDDDSEGELRDALADWKPGEGLLAGKLLTTADRFAVTMAKSANGQYVCTGVGLGIDPAQGETKDGHDLKRAIEKGDATEILSLIAGQIARTELSQALREEIAKDAGKQNECLVQRLEELSLEILAAKGESDAAKILIEQRLAAIESAVGLLKLR